MSRLEIPHEMILASAGSGKTWQLTSRYIGLMALQLRSGEEVAPDRILAATFTRKAAGEFFDSILIKLAKAAADPREAQALASNAEDPLSPVLATLDSADYTRLLRVFVTRMPRLFLGTLDSFFANLLRAFPAEFGLAGGFETMDEYQSVLARAKVYETVFTPRPRSGKSGDEAQRAFLEAFRLATLGSDENRVTDQLDDFLRRLHKLFLSAPAASCWGQAEAIWPDGGQHWFPGEIQALVEGERLLDALRDMSANGEKVEWKYWNEFVADLDGFRPGMPLTPRLKYVAERVLPVWKEILSGKASIKFNRTIHELGPEACTPLRRIFQWLIGGEIRGKLDRSRGLYQLLQFYEKAYAQQVRRRGYLTFEDVQLLLTGRGLEENGNLPRFTQFPDEDARLRIDYRLDARYDHWLLDEFQDTNPLQWSVIENLVDEVIQDASGTRSLFQVGDLKQAIYAWRGGDTRLFADIAARYNAHEERIRRRHLDVSWRSGHDVIETVNRIFGDRAALEALQLPPAALAQWEWHPHRVAPKNESVEGCTYLLQPLGEGGGKPGDEERYQLIAGILEEIDPVRRGLSCAILVQRNKEAEMLVDALRARTRIPVIGESEIYIASDNPLNRALLCLFQVAAHPGDTFAWEHLRMGPLRHRLGTAYGNASALSRQVLAALFADGFEAVTRHWIGEFEDALGSPLDEFTRRRAEEFALAGRRFDEGGSRSIDEFLTAVTTHRIREASGPRAVQVMTIHMSKGLTFDAVILPELGGNSLDIPRREIGARQNAAREVEWVMELPRKEYVEADPTLSDYARECAAEAAYENLCKFYVALTRASRANYLIVEPRGPKSESNNFVRLLEDVLAGAPQEDAFGGVPATVLYASATPRTNRRWYQGFEIREAAGEAGPATDRVGVDPRLARPRPRRRTPSSTEKGFVSARQIFSRGGGVARELGNLVHALFEEIEWADQVDLAALEVHWRQAHADSPALEEAIAQVREVLEHPCLRAALARPGETAEAWRERSFEILLDDEWLSGTFDRVVLERDADDRLQAATILDFKTDRVFSEDEIAATAAQYRPQLETYREVLHRMTGLPRDAIRCQLLLTRSKTLCEL